jgi:hypothetical protein
MNSLTGLYGIYNNYLSTLRKFPITVDSEYSGDNCLGKIRLDPETMLSLKVYPGDLLVIEGKRQTIATIWRLLREDWNQHKIRIDEFTRFNAGVIIGEKINISRVFKKVEASRIVIEVSKDFPPDLKKESTFLFNSNVSFAFMKYDIIPIVLTFLPPEQQIVTIRVIEMEPENANYITNKTKILISDNEIPDSENILLNFNEYDYIDITDLSQPEQIQNIQICDKINDDPLKIIKIRYAKGEISKAEYEDMEQVLKK